MSTELRKFSKQWERETEGTLALLRALTLPEWPGQAPVRHCSRCRSRVSRSRGQRYRSGTAVVPWGLVCTKAVPRPARSQIADQQHESRRPVVRSL